MSFPNEFLKGTEEELCSSMVSLSIYVIIIMYEELDTR